MSVILVDMDGPLADFDRHFYDRCIRNGWGFDIAGPEHQRHRYFTEHVIDREHRKMARAMVDGAGWFERLPVTPGAQEGMEALRSAGHDVWVCTKPLEVNPTCRDAKAAWLREHFGKDMERRMIVAPDKSMIVGDVLLDDAPKREWYSTACWTPVIFTAAFNGHDSEWAEDRHWDWGQPIEELAYAFDAIGAS